MLQQQSVETNERSKSIKQQMDLVKLMKHENKKKAREDFARQVEQAKAGPQMTV